MVVGCQDIFWLRLPRDGAQGWVLIGYHAAQPVLLPCRFCVTCVLIEVVGASQQ